jgi:hypothetical protein
MTQLYPNEKARWWEWDKSGRKWRVKYHLIYDGGSAGWTGYYRTYIGARIAAGWNYHIASWGGSAGLERNETTTNTDR